jgi:hypothetical protein
MPLWGTEVEIDSRLTAGISLSGRVPLRLHDRSYLVSLPDTILTLV